jgi:hypothetical protein
VSAADRGRLNERRKNGPYRLLVEGQDDKFTVINLLARHGIDWDAQQPALPFVDETEGIESLLSQLPIALESKERLGIVVDMDDPRDKDRWAQVRDRLLEKGVAAPDTPALEGTIISPGLRGPSSRIGVWIMPDNQRPGALEHFLSALVPPGDPCISYAEEATTRARALGAALAEKDHMKGTMRTWLAWQAHPGVPPGVAITAQYLRHDSPEALRFVAWFKRLFLEPAAVPPPT